MSEIKTPEYNIILENICDNAPVVDTAEAIVDEGSRRSLCNKINDFNLGGIAGVTDYINLSSIASKLINEAGRWCDRYSSDFIIDWDHVRYCIAHALSDDNNTDLKENGYHRAAVFGMRASGIDHFAYVYSNMSNRNLSIDDHYARIYAVDIDIRYVNECYRITISLKDIKSRIDSAAFNMRKGI